MIAALVKLEEARAGRNNDTCDEIEAKRYLDAAAWFIAQHERKCHPENCPQEPI